MPLDSINYQPCENARLLREAAQYIKTYGHTKRQWRGEKGERCIHGAIGHVVKNSQQHVELAEIMLKYATKELNLFIPLSESGPSCPNFTAWNDAVERTKEDVINLLEGAANFAEQKALEKV